MKRYFLITYTNQKGATGDVCISCSRFPSKEFIGLKVRQKDNLDLRAIRNIFEFKKRADYDSFNSNWTEDYDDIVTVAEPIDYNELIKFFNYNCGNIPKINTLTVSRKNKVNFIINKYTKIKLVEVIKSLKASPFLQGDSEIKWVADFDWIIKESNFVNILEGKYKEKTTTIVIA